jgi:nitroreductase
MQARRSCRVFLPEPVPLADVHRILAAARTAPVSLPPSGVGVLILHGVAEVQAFRRSLVDVVARRRWCFRAPWVWLRRPFVNRARWKLLRMFVGPVLEDYLGLRPERPPGADNFFYRAPLAYVFYGSGTAEPADSVIAATHAMLAAEALGYGTCFLGFPGYLLAMDARVKEDHGIPRKARPGLTLIVGQPAVPPVRGLHRHFAREDWLFNGPAGE